MNESVEQTAGNTVALFATCLIDAFRPNAGFAAVRLLEQAGYRVVVPPQACCGQPNFNGGDAAGARAMARRFLETFAGFDHVVVPSASCASMIRRHYPELFADDAERREAISGLAANTWELTEFLVEVAGADLPDNGYSGTVIVHDACSALRELGIRAQPRKLLDGVSGCREQSLQNPEVCCGFGGLFCIKYPEISARIADKKLSDIRAAEGDVDALVSTDLGCLMHLGGKLHRDAGAAALPTLHIAEVLAGMTDATTEDSLGTQSSAPNPPADQD